MTIITPTKSKTTSNENFDNTGMSNTQNSIITNTNNTKTTMATTPPSTTTSNPTSNPNTKHTKNTNTPRRRTTSTSITKFRAHQHKNLRWNNIHSKTNQQQQHPSAWALASPRFAGSTKFHEAMKTPKNDNQQNGTLDVTISRRRHTDFYMCTPGRRYHHNHNSHHNHNQRRPHSCGLDQRRRRTRGNSSSRMNKTFDDIDAMDIPAYEVHIPTKASYELQKSYNVKKHLDCNENKGGNNHEDDEDTHFSTISSPPKARKLNLNQYLNDDNDENYNPAGQEDGDRREREGCHMILNASSLTDSNSGHHDDGNSDDGDTGISYDQSNKNVDHSSEVQTTNHEIAKKKKEEINNMEESINKHEDDLHLLGISSNSSDYESVPWNLPPSIATNEGSYINMIDSKNNVSSILNDYDDDDDNISHEEVDSDPFFYHEKQHQHQSFRNDHNITATSPLRKMTDMQQAELIATVPRLLLSIQKLESTVANLSTELKGKDDTIDQLKRDLMTVHGHNNDLLVNDVEVGDDYDENNKEEGRRNELIKRELRVSNRQTPLSLNIDTSTHLLHQSPDNEIPSSTKSSSYMSDLKKRDEIKLLKELHQNEILTLTEVHRRDYLDLQEKTLNWIISKSDLMQEQSRELANVRQEMCILKENYDGLKVTANQAFVEAQDAIAKNCETLSLYVQEEIRETEQAAGIVINELQCELEHAYEQIASLQKSQCGQEVLENNEEDLNASSRSSKSSNYIPNFKSWRDFSAKFRDAISGKMPVDEKKESDLDTAAVLKAESLIKELCFDASVCSTTSLQSEDFLDTFENEETLTNENIGSINTVVGNHSDEKFGADERGGENTNVVECIHASIVK